MAEPEDRHRTCWYGRRTPELPPNFVFHTIEDGHLLYCAHPMLFPVVGFQFDVRNCSECEYFRARSPRGEAGRPPAPVHHPQPGE
jgi:hypothetical protein